MCVCSDDIVVTIIDYIGERDGWWRAPLVCTRIARLHVNWVSRCPRGQRWCARVVLGAPVLSSVLVGRMETRYGVDCNIIMNMLRPHELYSVMSRACMNNMYRLVDAGAACVSQDSAMRLLSICVFSDALRCAKSLVKSTSLANMAYITALAGMGTGANSVVAWVALQCGVPPRALVDVDDAILSRDTRVMTAVACARATVDDVFAVDAILREHEHAVCQVSAAAVKARAVGVVRYIIHRWPMVRLDHTTAVPWAPLDVMGHILRQHNGPVPSSWIKAVREKNEDIAAVELISRQQMILQRTRTEKN